MPIFGLVCRGREDGVLERARVGLQIVAIGMLFHFGCITVPLLNFHSVLAVLKALPLLHGLHCRSLTRQVSLEFVDMAREKASVLQCMPLLGQ